MLQLILLFSFVFVGVFIYSFATEAFSNSEMPAIERMARGEISMQYNSDSKSIDIRFGCGGVGNFMKYDLQSDKVSSSAQLVSMGSAAASISLGSGEKEILGASELTLGFKFSDLVEIREVPKKELSRQALAVIFGAASGYYLGSLTADWTGLHCRSALDNEWVNKQDWKGFAKLILAINIGHVKRCIREIQILDVVENPDPNLATKKPGELSALIAAIHSKSLATDLLRFYRTYHDDLIPPDNVKTSDLEMGQNAIFECNYIKNRGFGEIIVRSARLTHPSSTPK